MNFCVHGSCKQIAKLNSNYLILSFLQIQHKRTALLQTPVVEEMLNHKWKTFVIPIFMINIFIHILFVALFTAVVLVGPFPQSNTCNGIA